MVKAAADAKQCNCARPLNENRLFYFGCLGFPFLAPFLRQGEDFLPMAISWFGSCIRGSYPSSSEE